MGYQKPDKNKDYALILGASSGFGEAVSMELASIGFNIIGIHMDRGAGLKKAQQIVNKIENLGVEAHFYNMNAASEKKRREAVEELIAHFNDTDKKIKVLLHSLAFGSLAPYLHAKKEERLTSKQMDMTLAVMAHSLVYWTQDLYHNN